ncbi:MAG: 16S rRNA (cytosine(1402)-N(4))-methyltransferase RsmH [Nitrososphaerota archaeon]|nr:16S rRNA (cytosine(1402)-N(4))-methyltransferase RsmH [Candidatus Bathyarchaeota archaeon]MDW8194523.1 16S rRNA (cytosine(1402)-N(4))-methyltransferase RsmH [Nitrososphaerota archaeon]
MHFPVMLNEVIRCLDPKPGENFVDCTVGEGGHARAILDRNGPDGRVLGIDLDPEILHKISMSIKGTDYANRLLLVHGNFSNLKAIVEKYGFSRISGVLFDLGFSAWHIEQSGRGFSLWRNEPLDMRYDLHGSITAEAILNFWSLQDIERILRVYGEERFYRRIAREIVDSRPLKTTMDLVMAVERATPRWYHRQRIHFATRTFQALRIAVNNELENLEKALPQAFEVLCNGGRLVVISFHSLEDRIVKNFMKAKAKEGLLKMLTKKPLKPSMEEVKRNPRSRSAKLRAAAKLFK